MTLVLKPVSPTRTALASGDGNVALATMVGAGAERVAAAWGGVVYVVAALAGTALVIAAALYALSFAVMLLGFLPQAPLVLAAVGALLLLRLTFGAVRRLRSSQ